MKNLVKNLILLSFLLLFNSVLFAQKGKAVLIMKDSTEIHGDGEIDGIASIRLLCRSYTEINRIKTI